MRLPHDVNVIKLFVSKLRIFLLSRVLVSGAYSRVEPLKGTSVVSASAISPNIRLGRKSLPGTNTLAYYKKSLIMGKNAHDISPWVQH